MDPRNVYTYGKYAWTREMCIEARNLRRLENLIDMVNVYIDVRHMY